MCGVGDDCAQFNDPCVASPCGVGATCVALPAGQLNAFNLAYNCTSCASGQSVAGGKCVSTGQSLNV